jgi:subtilisin family serine protease
MAKDAHVLVVLVIAGLHFALGIFHHPGHMQTAEDSLRRCLIDSGVSPSDLQSDAQRIGIDRRKYDDWHFSPSLHAPLDAETIRAVELACGQPDGSAKITSARSFYIPCSTAAALGVSALGLSAQQSVPSFRMSSMEAAAVCAAASESGGSSVQLIATVAVDHAVSDIFHAFSVAFSRVQALPSIEVEMESQTVAIFRCANYLAPRLSHWLLHRAVVQHLQRRPDIRLMNANAAWVVQSNTPQVMSVWAEGVKGKGQTVHVGDTGVDWNLCFFQDAGVAQSIPPPFFQQLKSRSRSLLCQTDKGPLQPSTRHKFSAYISIKGGDTRDEVGGHGTHVCGSVAGGAPNTTELSKHNGMAPEAQLSFTDLQGADGSLSVPNDLCNSYFPCAYLSGARVSSNSWGGGSAAYDTFSASVDQFTIDHDDMLIVFAAGNDGPGPFTVSTPSIAKNALSVGATLNGQTNADVGYAVGIKFWASNPPSVIVAQAALADFAVNPICVASGSFSYKVVIPTGDAMGCLDLCSFGQKPFANSLVLLKRGDCTFQSKASKAISCGAAAVVIVNYEDTLIVMAGDGTSPSVGNTSVFLIKNSDGNRLSSMYTGTFPVKLGPPEGIPLAPFSATGPTYDGRIKPDIVAPGMLVLSAKAMNADECVRDPTRKCSSCSGNGFCQAEPSVRTMMGTSMSTPIVSGAASLVRQYFTDGLYPPSAVPGQRPSGFLPSSALLRAMLLASGQSIMPLNPARDGDAFSLNNLPSLAQGHGIIQLDSVLVFEKTSSPLSRLFVLDRQNISSHSAHYYTFQSSRRMAPQVTLSWTDPPVQLQNMFLSALVNDLNLELHSPSGRVTAGNCVQNVVNDVSYAVYDTENNNERVVVDDSLSESGNWTVVVRALRVLKRQQYSLVFSAAVEFAVVSPQEPSCPSSGGLECSNNGQCLKGRCICNDITYGAT